MVPPKLIFPIKYIFFIEEEGGMKKMLEYDLVLRLQ
jgi:hypothetical protein